VTKSEELEVALSKLDDRARQHQRMQLALEAIAAECERERGRFGAWRRRLLKLATLGLARGNP
jgi:hypothetical protein